MQNLLSFNNAMFDDIHSQAAKTRRDYEDTWNAVRNQVLAMLDADGADETLRQHIETRQKEVEELFKLYDADHSGMNTAMIRAQQVGNDGAQLMRSVMGGGGMGA